MFVLITCLPSHTLCIPSSFTAANYSSKLNQSLQSLDLTLFSSLHHICLENMRISTTHRPRFHCMMMNVDTKCPFSDDTLSLRSNVSVSKTPWMNQRTLLRSGRFFPTETVSFGCVRCTITGESESQNNRIFILGTGYVGQFFATDLKSKGWAVSGTCTSIVKKKKLEEMGFDAYVFDANDPQTEVLDIMKSHTHLLVSVPPIPGVGDPMLQHKDMLKSRLENGNLQWLSYLSSTRVYGDSGGAWVDEDHPITPSNELARTRLAVEEGWLNLGCDLKVAVQVFRLGGIYGPGRSAIDTIIKQEPLSRKQKVRSLKRYTSRIHVADICQALNASIQKPSSRRIFNLVDDNAASRKEVFTFAWNIVKNKWPDIVEKPLYDEVAEAEESMQEKRVCNARMKEELGVELLYPTYQAGLKHIVDNIDISVVDNIDSIRE